DDEQRRAGDLHAVLEGVPRSVDAGKGGEQRVVAVEVAPPEPGQEGAADELEEPRGDDEVRLVTGHLRGERGVPGLPGGVVPEAGHEGGDTGRTGPLQASGARSIRSDGHDGRSVG